MMWLERVTGAGGAETWWERWFASRRPSDGSRFRMENIKRVPETTTLILESEAPRVPKRANFFTRALNGDLGEKARRERWRFAYKTPIADAYVKLIRAMVPHQNGAVSAEKNPVTNGPVANARGIKSLMYYLGADMAGACEAKRYAWYSHQDDGTPIDIYHRSAVVMLVDQGFETMEGASGDDWISGAQSMRAYIRGGEICGVVAAFIRSLGWSARSQTNADSDVLQLPLVLLAGLGELSRIGELVLNPFVGPRFKSAVVTTDLPLAWDQPIDFGLQACCGQDPQDRLLSGNRDAVARRKGAGGRGSQSRACPGGENGNARRRAGQSKGKTMIRIALFTLISVLAALPAAAQEWPSKPVKLIVPFPPGGSVDPLARLLGAKLGDALKQQFIVENRPGAGGSIGTSAVAKAPADGYTFAVVFDSHGVNQALIANLPYDTAKDFAPVMLVGTAPYAIATQAGKPWKSFAEVVAASKAKPESVSIGSIGNGTLGHLVLVQVQQMGGFRITHAPFAGGGPMNQNILGGQIDMGIGSVALLSPQVRGGKMRAIATTGEKRAVAMPDVPTLIEQGFAGLTAHAWWGIYAPAGTPKPIIDKFHAELVKVLSQPDVRKTLAEGLGMDLVVSTPEELQKWTIEQLARWGKIVKDNNIKTD